MKAIYGLYETPEAAQRAFSGLRASGVAASDITVMSPEPLEEWEFASQDSKTAMSWIAVLGAAGGLATAYLLTAITQKIWPITAIRITSFAAHESRALVKMAPTKPELLLTAPT